MSNKQKQPAKPFSAYIPVNPALVGAAYHYTDPNGYFWVGYARNWMRFRAQTSKLDAVFALLDGSRSLEIFLGEAQTIATRLSKDQLLQMLQALAHKGLLMTGSPVLAPELEASPNYLERHSRDLEFYALFEKENSSRYDYLARVKSAKIAVIGLGGVGSWLSMSLACLGFGELVGIDFDAIELSNLARQILYTPADLGQMKTTAAQAFFARFTPEMQFHPCSIQINGVNDIVPLIRNTDFVVLTADWPPRRIGHWVNQSCMELNIPALYMSANASYVNIGPLVIPGYSSCYECLYIQRRQREAGFSSLEIAAQREDWFADPAPALSPLPGLTGHMLTWEVLCTLTGIQQPCTVGYIQQLDLTTFEVKRFPIEKQPTCSVCAAHRGNEQRTFFFCKQEMQSAEGGDDEG